MCMHVCVCLCVGIGWHMLVDVRKDTRRIQKSVSDALVLEGLPDVGAGNQTLVLCRGVSIFHQ